MELATGWLLGLVVLLQTITLAVSVLAFRKASWSNLGISRIREQIQKSSTKTTRQIEELWSVYCKTGFKWGELPPTRGWAASPDFLNLVFDTIQDRKPSNVIELGSGVSTLVIAIALAKNENGALVTVDHNQDFLSKTKKNLYNLNLDKFVETIFAPLRDYNLAGKNALWYDLDISDLPDSIDLIVVDGPPEPIVGEGGRFPVMHFLFEKLSKNGCVIFDDAARDGEKKIFEDALKLYPNMSLHQFPTEKGAVLLIKNTD